MTSTCPGYSPKLSAILANPRGHQLVALDCTLRPSLFCLQCHRWADTGKQGLLANQGMMCPKQTGGSWHKKFRALGKTVFQARRPPNPKRQHEVVHAIIAIDDDPRTRAQLRYSQELYESWRALAIDRLIGGPITAVRANDELEVERVPTAGRAQRMHNGPATIPLLSAQHHWHADSSSLPAFADGCTSSGSQSSHQCQDGNYAYAAGQVKGVPLGPTPSTSPPVPRELTLFPSFPVPLTPRPVKLRPDQIRQPKSARTQ